MRQINQELGKRKSVIHVQNVFLVSPIDIYYVKETGRYIIGYEPKTYRIHSLVIKIDKKLLSQQSSVIEIKEQVDINVKEDYRIKVKENEPFIFNGIRTVMRIVPSRYISVYNSMYAVVMRTLWRHTRMGGLTTIEFGIPECPIIVNSTTVNGICYKLISVQRSFGGTHGTNTYIIISSKKGQYEVGKSIKISNSGKSYDESPLIINL
jgi:hypothetical protein